MLEMLALAITQIALKEQGSCTVSMTNQPETETTRDITSISYPVIIIKGFMSRERAKNDYIYNMLAVWAAQIEENHLAHIVFVSNNPGAVKALSKGIPFNEYYLITSDAI